MESTTDPVRPVNTLRHFHVLAKPTGAICNLDCKYCFFLSKEMLYPGDRFRMADDLLETYIRQLLESQPGPRDLGGVAGRRADADGARVLPARGRARREVSSAGHSVIEHTIQTNGTELTDEWCSFFREHGFLVGLSIDGPREMHDLYRVDKGGRPTFDKVMRAARLMQTHGVEFNILTTVHAGNVNHPLEVYRFFRDEVGTKFIQFIPIVERVTAEMLPLANEGWGERGSDPRPLYLQDGGLVTDRTVPSEGWGRFLNAIFDEWITRDVGTVFVQMFDAALASWVGAPAGCASSARPAATRSRSSTTAISTRAITSSSRGICSATSARCTCCSWSTPISSARSVMRSGTRCRRTAAAARSSSPVTASARRTGSSRRRTVSPG